MEYGLYSRVDRGEKNSQRGPAPETVSDAADAAIVASQGDGVLLVPDAQNK